MMKTSWINWKRPSVLTPKWTDWCKQLLDFHLVHLISVQLKNIEVELLNIWYWDRKTQKWVAADASLSRGVWVWWGAGVAPSAGRRPRPWPEKRTTNDEETLFWLSCPCNALHLETPSCTIFKTHLAPPLLAGLLLLLLLPPDLLLLLGGDLLRGLGDLLPLHHHDHNDHRQMKFNPTCHPGILSLEDFFLPCKETSCDLRSCMIQFSAVEFYQYITSTDLPKWIIKITCSCFFSWQETSSWQLLASTLALLISPKFNIDQWPKNTVHYPILLRQL